MEENQLLLFLHFISNETEQNTIRTFNNFYCGVRAEKSRCSIAVIVTNWRLHYEASINMKISRLLFISDCSRVQSL